MKGLISPAPLIGPVVMTAEILPTDLCDSQNFTKKLTKSTSGTPDFLVWTCQHFFQQGTLLTQVCDAVISQSLILPLLFVNTVHPLKSKILFICLLVWLYHISSYESFDWILKCSTI